MGQYIGARYVPKFMGVYDPTQIYEALDVVDNGLGTSYITKIPTPAGTPLTNTTYWAIYGASSGAIVNLQNQINDMQDGTVPGSLQDQINDNASDITALSNNKANLSDVAIIYDTMADVISNVANLVVDYVIKTKGYYSVDDGGGAFYVIKDSTSNDAFYISLGDGLYAALIDDYTDVNVKQCGVKTDTTTSAEADTNSDNINAIIDIIYTLHPAVALTTGFYYGGGSVYFPEGRYKLNKPLTSANGKLCLTIHGAGKFHTRISIHSVDNRFALIENTSDYSHIMSLSIHDIMLTNFTSAVNLVKPSAVEIYECAFQGNTNAIRLDSVVGLWIHDNLFLGGDFGISLTSTQNNSTTLYIFHNWFKSQSDTAIVFDNAGTNHGFRTFYVDSNIIEYAKYGVYAIGAAGYSNMYLTNNHVEQCTSAAIYAKSCAFKLKNNDIDTALIITDPVNGQPYDLDDFSGTVSLPGGINDKNLMLIRYSKDGRIDDTINMKFRRVATSVNLATFPNNDTGNNSVYRITYESSNGIYSAVGTWVRGSSGWSPVASTVIASGVSAPATNSSGTVAFNDAGNNPKITIEFMGYSS